MRLCLVFACAATMMSMPAAAASCGKDEAALREAKVVTWPELYRRQDTDGLAAFLAESFIMVSPDGNVSTRAEEIAWVAKHPWQPHQFSYTITRIDCPSPDVALIIGNGRSVRRDENGRVVVHSYASSNLFLLQSGRWRAAMSHVSGETSKRNEVARLQANVRCPVRPSRREAAGGASGSPERADAGAHLKLP